jgi:hypothetical protein
VIDRIEWQGLLLALVLHRDDGGEGVNFITPDENTLQLGVMKHKSGVKIKPHVHKNITRNINQVQEVLHIDYGKVEAEFYDGNSKKVVTTILNSGDTIILVSGGHGFNILEDARIIEVKQGPYYGAEDDKVRFDEGGG